MRTVAVTGITGKSGQWFLRKLIENAEQFSDWNFIFMCREQTSTARREEAGALIRRAQAVLNAQQAFLDLKDGQALDAFFAEHPVDMVFHIASIYCSLTLVATALKHGVDDFVLVHTTGIYSKYKAAGEAYRRIEAEISTLAAGCREQGRNVALTILRPTMIYGDLQDGNISVFIKMVDKLRLFPVVNGARYDLQPVWCKDLGDAYYGVLTHWQKTAGKEYILSGGAPIQLRDMLCEIGKQLGVQNVFVSCPFPIAYAGAWAIWLLSFGKVDYREKVQRLVEPRAYGHDEAARDFGYAPAEFAAGVSAEIQMYKERKTAIK